MHGRRVRKAAFVALEQPGDVAAVTQQYQAGGHQAEYRQDTCIGGERRGAREAKEAKRQGGE